MKLDVKLSETTENLDSNIDSVTDLSLTFDENDVITMDVELIEESTELPNTFSSTNSRMKTDFRETVKTVEGGGGSAVKQSSVNLTSMAWQGETSPYRQIADIEGVGPYTKVDLTPSADQLAIFYEKDVMFVTENVNGIVTVYLYGQRLENDYLMSCTLTEVATEEEKIIGNTVGTTLNPSSIEGGNGAITSVTLTNQNGTNTITKPHGNSVNLMFTFTSLENDLPTGPANCKITVNGITKVNMSIQQGLTSYDVAPLLNVGTNKVEVTCTDVYGSYRKLAYEVTIIQLTVESTFDATVPYDDDITFKYTPFGAVEKTVHFVIDGTEVGNVITALSGKQLTKTFDKMSHGVHRLEVYSTCTINEENLESPKLVYDIMCLEKDETTSMIASVFEAETIEQGVQVSIPYIVYDPTKLACDIELVIYTKESGQEIIYSTQELTVDRGQKIWNTRKYPLGNVYFKIKYGDIAKTHLVVVEESSIKIEAETNDLELHLTSEGRSNNESNPSVWTYGDYSATFSNMNWKSVGWVADDNGDTCLRLNGDARAEINFQPFKDDLRTYGKTIELDFAIRDVNNRDAVVISCMNSGLGIEVKPDTAYLMSEQTKVFCNYKEEERVRVAFVVESKTEYRQLSIYLNGILSDVVQYEETDNFKQNTPVNITIGSPYCAVDVYNIRSYSTSLTDSQLATNYIADMSDLTTKTILYEENDIYDEFGNIDYTKAKEKNSVMVLVGSLPTMKGDKKIVDVHYYDIENTNLNFTESKVTIDVQGTSSQWYVRKNWKLKFANNHYIDADQLPAKVICIKVDYAEATGTHNTQNAVFVEKLYKEKVPAQEDNPKVRTTIYGKPILLFHQIDEGSNPVFYGKANFNYDKGAEHVFGFTENYDVECWEFKNNDSDCVKFLGNIPTNWGDDFEARYPEESKDISRFKTMHDWVVSTKGNVTKFKNEFEQYFDLHYTLIYYVYTFFALMTDQRAKNLFLTYWGETGKWYPYFYDNDTSFGINNQGELVYDYWHEDCDTLGEGTVYNGQTSTLWVNFSQAFADEIGATYRDLRSNGILNYDELINQFVVNGSDKWSISIYNEDTIFKYVSMLKSDNNGENLKYARGNGEEHLEYFLKNRLNYCDSKWFATDYADDYVSFRVYTPVDANGNPRTDLVVPANANITVTPYSSMYAGVRYGAGTQTIQQRAYAGEEITFQARAGVHNNVETAVFGASQISSFGDLSPLYTGTVNVSKATKITELIVGNGTEGYVNTNLNELKLDKNQLLKKIDVQNCPNLKSPLGLSGCPNIEEIYAKGSGITSVVLPDSGYLKKVQLPNTITNLTLKNQEYIEEFSMEGYNSLKALHIENCPIVDSLNILNNAPNIERVRLTNVDWSYPDASFLLGLIEKNIAGIDENGEYTDTIWLDGKCHITTLTGDDIEAFEEAFPYLTITYDNLVSNLIFMDEDGNELCRQTIEDGGDGVDPIANGTLETPTKESTAQYHFEYIGWTRTVGGDADPYALINVVGNRYLYYAYKKTLREYTAKFYNVDNMLLESHTLPYGTVPTYSQGTPVHPTNPDFNEFICWSPEPSPIECDVEFYAQYFDSSLITDSWGRIALNVEEGTATSLYPIGSYKPVTITYEDGTSETIDFEVIAHNHDELADGTFTGDKLWVNNDIPFNGGAIVNLNGELHSIWRNGHKKFDKSTSTWVSASSNSSEYLSNFTTKHQRLVINNEIHVLFYQNTSNIHVKFNGTEWVHVSDLTTNFYHPYSATVFNNEIHILCGNLLTDSQKKHIKFNGTEWVDVSTIPYGGSPSCVEYNGELHAFWSNSKHCKWNGTEWIEVGTTPIAFDGYNHISLVYENKIYVFHDCQANDVYCWDGESWTRVCTTPFSTSNTATGFSFVVYENKIHLFTCQQNLASKILTNPKATLTFFAKNPLKDDKSPNNTQKTDSNGNTGWIAGGWGLTDLRKYLNEDIFNSLPLDLQNAIKTVKKLSDGGTYNKTIVSTDDKITVPTYTELGLYISNPVFVEGQGEPYPVFTDNASRIRTKLDGIACEYWCRESGGDYGLWTVSEGGHTKWFYGYMTSQPKAICIMFCI